MAIKIIVNIVLLCVINWHRPVEACGGCSTCALSDPACVPIEMKTEYVPYSTGWWLTKRTGYTTVYKYYKGEPYCCGGYTLDGLTCRTEPFACGGCDGTGIESELSCVHAVQQKVSRSSVIAYECSAWWWSKKTCYRTSVYYELARKEIRTCCAGYVLNGIYCVKDTTPKTCGISKYPNPGLRLIVGGTDAQPNEFPWQLLLIIDGTGLCGGTLIGSQWVLTAAHCAYEFRNNPARITVKAGDHLFDTYDSTEQVRSGFSVFVHGEYDPNLFINDIALIRVSSPFTINDYVRPACLPETCDEVYVEKEVIISGWGRSSAGDRNVPTIRPNVLQFAIMTVKPQDYCRMFAGSLSTILCCSDNVGDTTKSPCFGDSGGPMVLKKDDGHFTVVGVASFVADLGCAEGLPSGYTDVRPYLRWIKQIVF